jgi:hypothetical protein
VLLEWQRISSAHDPLVLAPDRSPRARRARRAGCDGKPALRRSDDCGDRHVRGWRDGARDGDVNADGIADLVVTRLAFPIAHATFPIGVFLGDGRGGFRDGSSLFLGPIPRTQHGRQIVIADFNADRRNDIFVADHGYDAMPFAGHPNTLALSTAEGKLVDASGNLPPESGFSHSATAADVDRDGDVDLYVGNLCCGDAPPDPSQATERFATRRQRDFRCKARASRGHMRFASQT